MTALATRHVDVLLVEDNEADVQLTTAAFRDAMVDIHIHAVKNGEEAIAFLKRTGEYVNAPQPDLILLDLSLADIMDGFQLLAEIKHDAKLKKIAVIIVSGSDRGADRARAYELQAAGYLVKPVDLEKYFAAIRQIKELWVHALSTAPKENDASA
jgi:CheY-like chemotaxis protein